MMYSSVLKDVIEKGYMSAAEDKVLVVCGGSYDASVLREVGFKLAVISNVDDRWEGELSPFEWAREDAESLSFPDVSFDWTIVHMGLHHCLSPHRGLLEMYRVARKGVVVIENRDSLLIRIAVAMGLTGDYELEAVAINEFQWGGVRNTAIPNYVYRWTEREVIKTIESFTPHSVQNVRFYYNIRLPVERLTMSSLPKQIAAHILGGVAKVAQSMMPKQCNEFGFVVHKTNLWKPWIGEVGGSHQLRRDYKLGFDPKKYRRNPPR